MHKINKSIAVERELAVTVISMGGGLTDNGPKIAFGNNTDILKADSGDEYTTLWAKLGWKKW